LFLSHNLLTTNARRSTKGPKDADSQVFFKKTQKILLLCTDDDNRSYRNVCNMSFVSFALAVINKKLPRDFQAQGQMTSSKKNLTCPNF